MCDDSFLLGVRIEQQAVCVKASRVRIPWVDRCVALGEELHRVGVSADRVEERVVENSSGTNHVGRHVTQIGNRECGDDHGAINVRNEPV